MGNTIQEEESNWERVLGRIFEFVKAISKPVRELGGTSKHVAAVLRNPDLGVQFAEVLMGRSKIVRIDPMEVIKNTGRTYTVKALAAADIESEEDRIKILNERPVPIIAEAVISGISQQRLFDWYRELSAAQLARWFSGDTEIIRWVIEAMNQQDQLLIALDCSWGGRIAADNIKNQKFLKRIMLKSGYGITRCHAISRINDLPFLERHLAMAEITDPHHTKNWAMDLWKRVGELRRQKELQPP